MSTPTPNHEHHEHNHPGGFMNTGDAEAVNGPTNTAEDTSTEHVTNGGTVVPLRPNTARSADELPRQRATDHVGAELAPDEAIDAEIVDDDGPAESVPVDPPQQRGSRVAEARTATPRPLIADWLRSRESFTEQVRWAVAYAAHTTAFHALRVPKYYATLVGRSPRGLARLVAGTWRWVYDAEGKPLRAEAVSRGEADQYLRLAAMREDRVRKRMAVAFVALLTLGAAVWLVVTLLNPLWQWAALAALVGVLGFVGSPADKPVAGRAVDSAKAPKLTSAAIVDALAALGIGELNKKLAKNPNAIGFPSPIQRQGPGWRADIDLPLGVTAGDVIERRAKLASGLRRQLGCVWPEADRSVHEGRLVLWVGDRDMSAVKQAPWPLAKTGQVDLFKPVPFGTDQRGRWVEQTFMYVSGVIGAIPRMGKTVTLREILLIAALDPRSELHPYDLKGTGDLSPLEPVAHHYGVGDDEEQIEAAVVDMRAVREEMRRRTKVLRSLPDDVCPDSRVEPHLVNNPKLGLKPIVIGVDECQVWFEHDKYGAELEEICTDLVKRGPATGIMLFLATQRPDSKSIPTGISANASFRFCLKVMGQMENDMVLGTSSYQAGIRATTFSWNDKGIGFLRGEGSDARIVRGVYTDKPGAKKIVARARALREAAGNITGYAAGQEIDASAARATVLQDVISVFGDGEDRLWSDDVVARLAKLRRDYADYTPDALAAALKPYGVTPKQVAMTDAEGARRNRRGYRLADLTKANTARHGGHAG
ncbi:hypothetical protein BAY59_29220 [Prauserella coralliicola]|nr:hypothetical protein BAY59_29220 [Prauserella coralliicola]